MKKKLLTIAVTIGMLASFAGVANAAFYPFPTTGGSGNAFAYPFIANATSTNITFSNGITTTGPSSIQYASTTAITSNFAWLGVNGGFVGIGTTTSGVGANIQFDDEANVNAAFNEVTRNYSAGTAAITTKMIQNDLGNQVGIQMYSSGNSLTQTSYGGTFSLANWGRVRASTGAAGLILGTGGNFPTVFIVNDNEVGRFTANGLGLGLSAPASALDITPQGWIDQGGNMLAYSSTTNRVTVFGALAGGQNSTTSAAVTGNTFIGYQSGYLAGSGANNTSVGSQAMFRLGTGAQNAAFGTGALLNITSGNQNAVFGYQAGLNIGTVSNNTLIGAFSGTLLTTGGQNTFLGENSASTTASGSRNIVIGYDIALPVNNGSNQLNIGNLIFGTGLTAEASSSPLGNLGIGTSTPWTNLAASGTIAFSNTGTVTGNCLAINSTTKQVGDAGNSNCSTSSKWTKKDIFDVEDSDVVAIVEALNPIMFTYDNNDKKRFGLIAEEVDDLSSKPGLSQTKRLVDYAQQDIPETQPDGTIHIIKKGEPYAVDYSGYTALIGRYVQIKAQKAVPPWMMIAIVILGVGLIYQFIIVNKLKK